MVACHSFDREQGEEGYFLISAHLLLIHGHMMPLTTRLLSLQGTVPVSPMLRAVLRVLIDEFGDNLEDFDGSDRMQVYESRNRLYLRALQDPQRCFERIENCMLAWLQSHEAAASLVEQSRQLLQLDALLCPRTGTETSLIADFNFDADAVYEALGNMELPNDDCFAATAIQLRIQHPGGVGDILFDADGGSWLRGEIIERVDQIDYVAIA